MLFFAHSLIISRDAIYKVFLCEINNLYTYVSVLKTNYNACPVIELFSVTHR